MNGRKEPRSREIRKDHGSTRPQQFDNEVSALAYLGRTLTNEQIAEAVRAVEFAWALTREWPIFRRLVSILSQLDEILGEEDFTDLGDIGVTGGEASKLLFARDLYAQLREELRDAIRSSDTQRLLGEAKFLLKSYSGARRNSRMLAGLEQVSCALVLRVVPDLGPLAMEALTVLAGVRRPSEEFASSHALRRAKWRTAIKKAKRSVLPAIEGRPSRRPAVRESAGPGRYLRLLSAPTRGMDSPTSDPPRGRRS